MNDTAEGLISFLSAHETLGDAGRLMGRGELTWRRFVWTAQRVLGTECTVSQIHLAVGRSLSSLGPATARPEAV